MTGVSTSAPPRPHVRQTAAPQAPLARCPPLTRYKRTVARLPSRALGVQTAGPRKSEAERTAVEVVEHDAKSVVVVRQVREAPGPWTLPSAPLPVDAMPLISISPSVAVSVGLTWAAIRTTAVTASCCQTLGRWPCGPTRLLATADALPMLAACGRALCLAACRALMFPPPALTSRLKRIPHEPRATAVGPRCQSTTRRASAATRVLIS